MRITPPPPGNKPRVTSGKPSMTSVIAGKYKGRKLFDVKNLHVRPTQAKVRKSIFQILNSQKKATENIFKKRKLPFRSFELLRRNEETLGELFCFFILETILIGKSFNLNPYDQPAVELIKKQTKKILI